MAVDEDLLRHELSGMPPREFKVYPARWVTLILFGMASLMNAVIWITFAPINSITGNFYDVNDTAVNMLSVVYMIVYIPGTYLSSFLFWRVGLRWTILAANILNVLGATLRLASVKNNMEQNINGYVLLLIGQTLCGLGQPIYVNGSARIAATWFTVEGRDIATVIASMFNPVGTGVGQILPALLVNSSGEGMLYLFLTELIAFGAILVLSFAFLQDMPPTPPSFTETTRQASRQVSNINLPPEHTESMLNEFKNDLNIPALALPRMLTLGGPRSGGSPCTCSDLKMLFSHPPFVKLCIGFGLGLAYFNTLVTVLGRQTEILGYSDDDAGLFGALILGFGLLGCAVAGPVMDCTHRYKTVLKIAATLALASVLGLVFALRPNNTVALCIVFSAQGFLLLPLLPTAFECMVECTYPMPEEVTNGTMLSIGNVLSIGTTFLWQYLINQNGDGYKGMFVPYNYLQVGMMFLALIFIYSFDGKYHRLEMDIVNSALQPHGSDRKSTTLSPERINDADC
ncbi:hypothetical protein AAMO2058_000721800 [Amorphochlora amoebiformis]